MAARAQLTSLIPYIRRALPIDVWTGVQAYLNVQTSSDRLLGGAGTSAAGPEVSDAGQRTCDQVSDPGMKVLGVR